MKILFYMPLENLDIMELDETTVGAQFEFLLEHCDEAKSWLNKNKPAILAHEHERFVDVAKNSSDPIMRQFVGMKFSYEACCAINGFDDFEYESPFADAPDAIATAIPTEEFLHGAFDKQALIRFADQMQNSAKETTVHLLKEADVFGATLTDERLIALNDKTAQKLAAAVDISRNNPSKMLDTAFVVPEESADEKGEMEVGMRCWPNKKELREIHKVPEFYAVVTVAFR